MRRSAVRQAVAAVVTGVATGDDYTFALVDGLTHAAGLDLVRGPEVADHLVCSVELGRTTPLERGRNGQLMAAALSVQIVFRLRDGIQESQAWPDIDTANDLAEDVVAAVLTADAETDADWTASLVDFSVEAVQGRSDIVVLDLRFTVTHTLGA